jgi:hypothetical protein
MSKHTSPFPPNRLGKQEIHLLYWANDLRVKLVIGWKYLGLWGDTLDTWKQLSSKPRQIPD